MRKRVLSFIHLRQGCGGRGREGECRLFPSEKNVAAFTLLFVSAGRVPAIHRGANVICDRARRARFALHSCCTMDCRNRSGNDSIGGVKLSTSARRGGWRGTTAESEPRANTPSRRCRTPPAPKAEEEKGTVAFDSSAAVAVHSLDRFEAQNPRPPSSDRIAMIIAALIIVPVASLHWTAPGHPLNW
jgi:hypothetical protein